MGEQQVVMPLGNTWKYYDQGSLDGESWMDVNYNDRAWASGNAPLGYAKDGMSGERRFVEDLDAAEEVCVYAKLPRGFYIPTPVGNYSPDWAIAFYEGAVKHIYFVAETKGSLDSLQLRGVEKAKIDCAKRLFNKMSNSKVRYENVTNYQDLLDKMNAIT